MEGTGAGGAAPGDGIGEEAKLTGPLDAGRELRELREELRKAKDDYSMATGAISSLQRQLEIQESQLRRTTSEKETLQKRLRERADQLQAMSAKFCSLREERKHEAMMAAIEKENCSLRELVTEQECKLAEQNKLLGELQGRVSQLQAELLTSQCHLQRQQRAQEAIQSQAESLEHRELQARVALECLASKFERFRSGVLAAAFGAAGSSPPRAELSDQQVLEAVQKMASERGEFLQALQQRGIPVPALPSSDTSISSLTTAKARRKDSYKVASSNA